MSNIYEPLLVGLWGSHTLISVYHIVGCSLILSWDTARGMLQVVLHCVKFEGRHLQEPQRYLRFLHFKNSYDLSIFALISYIFQET